MNRTAGKALLSVALGPRTPADAQRLAHGLAQLAAADPTIGFTTHQATGEVVVAAVSEPQLETILDRLKREFNVEASVGRPRVAFKETLTTPAEGEMKYAVRSGGRGQYAHVRLRIDPAEPGTGCIIENNITGGAIPAEFIASVDEGIKDSLGQGVVAGYPIDDVRVEVYDGSYHDVDSTPEAFRIAGRLAAWIAVQKAKPVLLEPVMRIDTVVPLGHAHEVMASIIRRRGQIQSQQAVDETQVIRALVPLAGLFGYATDLGVRTKGRGTFTMQLERYQAFRPDDSGEGDRDSLVGAPLRPAPTLRAAGVALPEPDEGRARN